MNSYNVDVEHTHFWRYKVQAEDEEKAEQLVLDDPEFGKPENVDHLYDADATDGVVVAVKKVEATL